MRQPSPCGIKREQDAPGSHPSMSDCFAGSWWDRTTTSMENKVLLLQCLCRGRRNWGLWPGEASGGRQALTRICDTSSLSKEAAYFFFLGDKLCCFGLPRFPVSLVTPWWGTQDDDKELKIDRNQWQRSWPTQMTLVHFLFLEKTKPKQKGKMDVSWQRRWLCFAPFNIL